MRILTLNAGSSSLKFQIIEVAPNGSAERRLRGRIDAIGTAETRLELWLGGERVTTPEAAAPDHFTAARLALEQITGHGVAFDAVGHRIVHGGTRFTQPVRIDAAVTTDLELLSELAPLHNPAGLAGVRACRAALGPELPMVAVFDTAFHAALPPAAAQYALPRDWTDACEIRRFGFHGLAHRYLAERYRERGGSGRRLITLQLGNGCSAAAIRDGRSVDTSMGFTPLEGLMMGTRAGDLDPALIPHLMRRLGLDADTVLDGLNHRSGLLGVSGRSRDMQRLLELEASDAAAQRAIELFCYRVRKTVGAYLAVLGGADAVLFGGGIGENAPAIRHRILEGLAWAGLRLDPERNRLATAEARISADDSTCAAYVFPVDEERVIAQDTFGCLSGHRGESDAGPLPAGGGVDGTS